MLRFIINKILESSDVFDVFHSDDENIDPVHLEKMMFRQYNLTVSSTLSQLFIVFFVFFLFPTTLIDTKEIIYFGRPTKAQVSSNRSLFHDAQVKYGRHWKEQLMVLRERYIARFGIEKYNKYFVHKMKPIEKLTADDRKIKELMEYRQKLEDEKDKVYTNVKKKEKRYHSIFDKKKPEKDK